MEILSTILQVAGESLVHKGLAGMGAGLAAIGAGIGVAIDALIHSERAIYRRGAVRSSISPTLARGVRGWSVSVSW